MNVSHADVRRSQTLSLPEREIEFMLANGFRSPSAVSEIWNGQRFSAESANRFEADEIRKVPWLVELKTFCVDASVVGLRYVANASASPFRRSIWLLLLLAGAAFTTYQIQNRIRRYWSFPVSVNVRVEHKEEMRFPTVTICNENQVSRSAAYSRGNSLATSAFAVSKIHIVEYSVIFRSLISNCRVKLVRKSHTFSP